MKAKNIRLYYGIALSVFTCVLGVVFIATAISILADGGWIQGAYTREIVAKRLFPISIPFYIWIVAIIVGLVLSIIYTYEPAAKPKTDERTLRNRLISRMPEGRGEEYEGDLKRIATEKRTRAILYGVCAALCFASAIACAVYLLNPSNFTAADISEAMLNMLINVGPWLVVAFGCTIGLTLFEKYSLLREISVLKRLIASNKGNPVVKASAVRPAAYVKAKAILSSKYTLWAVRGGVALIAIIFIILGIFNEGARAVLIKAINICTECIGLG